MRVIGVGAGGHAKVLIDILRLRGEHEVVGLTDASPAAWGTEVLGVPVLGDDSRLTDLWAQGVRGAFVGVGSVGRPRMRQMLYTHTAALGFEMITVLHPAAVVAASARLGRGVMVMAGAVINADARIADNVIINTGAIIEHDCDVGEHAHVATGARLAGAVRVAPEAHIGLGASIRQGIQIGAGAIVGAGAVVVRDVAPGVTVVGVPARPWPSAAGAEEAVGDGH